MDNTLSWNDFVKVEMRVGTILDAKVFEEAHKPAYILNIDFGEFGVKKTSAQITVLYSLQELIGKQVIAVLNFPPKQIANVMSECLVLGTVDNTTVTLLQPDGRVENGLRVG